MADLSKTIKNIFDGVDSTGNVIQTVADKIDGFSDSVSNVTEPLSDFADNLILAEGAALVLGATIAGIAIKEAGQFNEAIAETGTLFNATSEQTDYLSERVRDFASTSTSNIATINESMYNAISATGDWENAHILLAQAEQLGVAGASNLGTATSALTTVMGAYGDKAGTAEEVSDALFVTVQNGKTTLNELESSIGRVATISATSNVSVDMLGAAMAALTVSTGNTSESATIFA
jgi:TP901 family phage tail tape measure protein